MRQGAFLNISFEPQLINPGGIQLLGSQRMN